MKLKSHLIGCALRNLPTEAQIEAARRACEINPSNAPALVEMHCGEPGVTPEALDPMRLAVLTSRYWGDKGVRLGVSFLDTSDTALKNRILGHMNAWGQKANVQFLESAQGEVRIARQRGDGYWSYLGTDVLSVRAGQATMNLDSFTMRTSEGEYLRVVRHETGHTLGFPHEHLRAAIIARLDRDKTLAYFRRTQGWDDQTIISNVLSPLNESALIASPADESSIMAYMLPASITRDGRPIAGGADIGANDHAHAARIYPLADVSPPPPGGEVIEWRLLISEGGRKVELKRVA